MDSDLITAALSVLTRVRARISDGQLEIRVPSINDGFRLPVENINWMYRTPAPNGGPAVAIELLGYDIEGPIIVTDEDLVFPPASSALMLNTKIHFQVTNAPPLVAYSEMERDSASVAAACANTQGKNLFSLAGSVLLIRCFIMGSVKFGAWPIKTAAWWHRGWQHAGGDLPLPDFRNDPIWDALALDAAFVEL
jgi:hypothetical protein